MIGPPSLYWCVQYQQKPDTSRRAVHYADIRTSIHHHDNILLSYLEKWENLKVQEGNRKFSWFSFKSDSTNPIFMYILNFWSLKVWKNIEAYSKIYTSICMYILMYITKLCWNLSNTYDNAMTESTWTQWGVAQR